MLNPKVLFFLIITLIYALTPQAGLAETCEIDPNDGFDTGHIMQAAHYRGICADTHDKRPAKILSEDQNWITFANLRHDGRWWTAKLSKTAVDRVILDIHQLSLPFFIHAAHSELRFILKKGSEMQLKAQSPSPGKPDIDVLGDFMWSMEYVAPKGVAYNAFVGLTEAFDAVDRIVSTQEQALEQLKSTRHPVQQWELKLNQPEDGDELLQKAIHLSEAKGYSQIYSTLKLNCNSALFELLDMLPDKAPNVPAYEVHWYQSLRNLHSQYADVLRERHLISQLSDEPNLPTLNDELVKAGIISEVQ